MNQDQLKVEFYGNFHKFAVDNLISNLAAATVLVNQLQAEVAELKKQLAEKDKPSA